jgi:hypothetical protein
MAATLARRASASLSTWTRSMRSTTTTAAGAGRAAPRWAVAVGSAGIAVLLAAKTIAELRHEPASAATATPSTTITTTTKTNVSAEERQTIAMAETLYAEHRTEEIHFLLQRFYDRHEGRVAGEVLWRLARACRDKSELTSVAADKKAYVAMWCTMMVTRCELLETRS